MASTTWRIQGIDTVGQDLVLSRVVPWTASGSVVPLSITSTFAPTVGAVENLLVDDNTECVFAAADVQKPGFTIEFTFAAAVDLWGFRLAGPGPNTWPLIHSLSDGLLTCTLGRVAWVEGSISPAPTKKPEFSTDTGAWVAQTAPGTRNWYGCAVSANGQVLLGAAYGGNLWLSTDGGASWVAQTAAGTRNWYGCAVSADGQVLLGSAYGGNLWLSTDRGASWVAQTAAGTRNWYECAVSADGQVLLGSAYGGNLWLSKDGGATWVAQTAAGTGNWYGCAVSADGQVLLGGFNGGNLWLSKNGGATWAAQTVIGLRDWRTCGASIDGQVLLGGVNGGNLWLSKDGGATWVAQTEAGSRNWPGCAVSADGQVLLGSASGGSLWLSKDGGTTWVAQTAAESVAPWNSCAVSADGQVLLGASLSGNLWGCIALDPSYLPNEPRTHVQYALPAVQGIPPDLQGTLNTHMVQAVQVYDTEFGGKGWLYGTVERESTPGNVPMRRRVRLKRSRDGMVVRETWSDAAGYYEFKHLNLQYLYDAEAWDHEGLQQSVIANDLQPEPMP